MKEHTIDYYFYLESSVFLFIRGKKALIYDTETTEFITIDLSSKILANFLLELADPDNMYSIGVTNAQLSQKSISTFIFTVRNKFFGDLVRVDICEKKPIVFMPILNFQKEKKRLSNPTDSLIGGNVMELLAEINIHLTGIDNYNDQMPSNLFYKLLSVIHPFNIKINLFGKAIWQYQDILFIKNWIQENHIQACWVSDYIDFYNSVQDNMVDVDRFRIIVNAPFEEDKLKTVVKFCKSGNSHAEYHFFVKNNSELKITQQFINAMSIEEYQINPVFINNSEFFKKNVYLNKNDILNSKLTKRQIYTHQTLNTYDFGRIHIRPNGDVYSNLHFPTIGNINTNTLPEILFHEMKDGQAWLRIRDQKPCCDCIYQWLCPSPSNYELIIGKPNLCHVIS